jgi:hypothetical protein
MKISEFDQMSEADRAAYVLLLIGETIDFYAKTASPDVAQRVHDLFTKKEGNGIPVGYQEFVNNLQKYHDDSLKHPNQNPSIHIQHAMISTLQENGIEVPKTYITVGNDFKPSGNASGAQKK